MCGWRLEMLVSQVRHSSGLQLPSCTAFCTEACCFQGKLADPRRGACCKQSMFVAWLSGIMMHGQVPGVALSSNVKHPSLPGEQAVTYGCLLLHAVGPEALAQTNTLPASIAWMTTALNGEVASRRRQMHIDVILVAIFCMGLGQGGDNRLATACQPALVWATPKLPTELHHGVWACCCMSPPPDSATRLLACIV